MIHGNTPLAHHLLELPIRNRIRYVPPHAPQDNFPLKLTTLEVDHAAPPPPHDQWRSIAESPSCENLRQNRQKSFTNSPSSLLPFLAHSLRFTIRVTKPSRSGTAALESLYGSYSRRDAASQGALSLRHRLSGLHNLCIDRVFEKRRRLLYANLLE